MQTTITVRRSSAWVAARRLECGDNVPTTIQVTVEIADLSHAVREILLVHGNGGYQQFYTQLSYDNNYRFSGSGWGFLQPQVDADTVTADMLDKAIRACAHWLIEQRQKAEEAAAAKDLAEQAMAKEWAALPLAWRAGADGVCYCVPNDTPADYRGPLSATGVVRYQVEVLRRLVPDAWTEAERERDRLVAVAKGEKAIADRLLLAQFLAHVPADALRGTLKAMAHDPQAVTDLRDQLIQASPMVIFDDEEEELDDPPNR